MIKQLTRSRVKEYDGLLIGMTGAGKTSLIQRFKDNSIERSTPTNEPIEHTLVVGTCRLNIVDVGGDEESRRTLWTKLSHRRQILIVVLNTLEPDELPIMKKDLEELLKMKEASSESCLVLILTNKVDLSVDYSIAVSDVLECLELSRFKNFKFGVFGTSATTGEGVEDCKNWLCKALEELPVMAYHEQSTIELALDLCLNLKDMLIGKVFDAGRRLLGQHPVLTDRKMTLTLQEEHNILKEQRFRILGEMKLEHQICQEMSGYRSQQDSRQLIERYDRESHEIYMRMRLQEKLQLKRRLSHSR